MGWGEMLMAKLKKRPEKPYSKPTFAVYGTVQQLTGTVGPKMALDGGAILGMRRTEI
jgi:hypothetical protein